MNKTQGSCLLPALLFAAVLAGATAAGARDKPARAEAGASAAAASAAASAPASLPEPPPAAKPAPVDINRADKAALLKLPGIDAERADAIVRGRPYAGSDELVSRKIISPSAYARIKSQLVVGGPAGRAP